MFSKLFWKDVTERALATAAQVIAGLLVADGVDVLSLDWKAAGATVLTAVVLVLVKAFIADKTVDDSMSPASLVTADPNDVP
jgi:hypothetical protein